MRRDKVSQLGMKGVVVKIQRDTIMYFKILSRVTLMKVPSIPDSL